MVSVSLILSSISNINLLYSILIPSLTIFSIASIASLPDFPYALRSVILPYNLCKKQSVLYHDYKLHLICKHLKISGKSLLINQFYENSL